MNSLSSSLLHQAQQSTGKAQKMLLYILQLQILVESGNLQADQKSALESAINGLLDLVPKKRDDSHSND